MTTLTRTLAAAEPVWACGCGPDPGALARFGLFGTAFLVLGGLTAMILAGWLLGGLVWAVGRAWRAWRGDGTVAGAGGLDGRVREVGAWGGEVWEGAEVPDAVEVPGGVPAPEGAAVPEFAEVHERAEVLPEEAEASFFGGLGRWEEERPRRGGGAGR
ncbi:hypothetical protein ACIBBD_38140 [Streptomyces sp. NPDC051315]|uniref:hypothetical protein n=1 Tax=Streptomyces sp. NPDC051315 TaxID=3365650 RepID=UPI0037B85044